MQPLHHRRGQQEDPRLPIETILVDARGREFAPVDDQYELRGNPGCNGQLQPGFEADTTCVHLVPTTAQVTGWIFAGIAEDRTAGPTRRRQALPDLVAGTRVVTAPERRIRWRQDVRMTLPGEIDLTERP